MIDREIKNGGLIGKTFRQHGYEIRKNVIDVYTIKLSQKLKKAFSHKSDFAKARLSEFYAKKESHDPVLYGIVVEVYSPDFRPATINVVDRQQVNPTTASFRKIGITENEIWKRLGSGNKWNDISDDYNRALDVSLDKVFVFKKLIDRYISRQRI